MREDERKNNTKMTENEIDKLCKNLREVRNRIIATAKTDAYGIFEPGVLHHANVVDDAIKAILMLQAENGYLIEALEESNAKVN